MFNKVLLVYTYIGGDCNDIYSFLYNLKGWRWYNSYAIKNSRAKDCHINFAREVKNMKDFTEIEGEIEKFGNVQNLMKYFEFDELLNTHNTLVRSEISKLNSKKLESTDENVRKTNAGIKKINLSCKDLLILEQELNDGSPMLPFVFFTQYIYFYNSFTEINPIIHLYAVL